MPEVPGGIPKHVDDIVTGVTERRAKTPSERQERVEQRVDGHDLLFAQILGKLEGQDQVLDNISGAVGRLEQREQLVFTAKVDVARAASVADIDDKADAKKHKRERTTKIIGAVIVAVTALAEILRQAGVL